MGWINGRGWADNSRMCLERFPHATCPLVPDDAVRFLRERAPDRYSFLEAYRMASLLSYSLSCSSAREG